MKKNSLVTVVTVGVLAFSLSGCTESIASLIPGGDKDKVTASDGSTNSGESTLTGGLLGAGAGAALGGKKGAIIGGTLGVIAGAELDKKNKEENAEVESATHDETTEYDKESAKVDKNMEDAKK